MLLYIASLRSGLFAASAPKSIPFAAARSRSPPVITGIVAVAVGTTGVFVAAAGVFVGTTGVFVLVGVLVTVTPDCVKLYEAKLKRNPVPPVNVKYTSCTPVAPDMVQVLFCHVCHPPVPATAHVPMIAPVGLPRRITMLPPLVALATRAEKPVAPVPKLTPFTSIQSLFSMLATLRPPSEHASVAIPDSLAIVTALFVT